MTTFHSDVTHGDVTGLPESAQETSATVRIAVRPSRSRGLLRRRGDAYVAVDGVEQPCAWGRPMTIPLAPGTHQMSVFAQLRGGLGRPGGPGRGTLRLTLGAGDLVTVVAAPEGRGDGTFRLSVVDDL
ncbi:hypothetical protein [Tsukamurella soli]|uniref:Uncharacterized protein n=1 Tax=Tsukamurella soli TaxID=644556 RepID=A0ABP8JBB6_9ACTN